MPEPINTVGQAVYSCSWREGWLWQAHTPEKLIQGTAASEDEGWVRAHAAASLLDQRPKGQG